MRDATPQLVAFLLTKRPFYQADLFSLAFLNAIQPTLTLTSSDQDVTDIFSGTTWYGSTPALGVAVLARDPGYPSATRSRWNTKNTVEIPTLDLELNSDGSDYAGGLNIKAMAHNGLFDGCQVTFQRAVMPVYGNTSLGLVMMFQGPVGPVQVAARGVKLTVKGANVRLQQFMPRNRFELGCIHALYDSGCTMVRGSFTTANTVGAGSTAAFILWGGTVPAAPGQYGLGYITFTSGVCEGQIRTIQAGFPEGVQLMYPLYDVPAPGDAFTVAFGCDKTLATCTNVFNNAVHYRGFPFIPPATMAV
jgi:uncharacterized phage protein (TIGR02218 family)